MDKLRCSVQDLLVSSQKTGAVALVSLIASGQICLAATSTSTDPSTQASQQASTTTQVPAAAADADADAVVSTTLETSANQDELVTTDDVPLARKQVDSYPDNPEAHFILAVALTRTSHVEEALQEVRLSRKLAQSKGGAEYFNQLIATYEKMLTYTPNENRVRYSLSWAYYMKAYLLAQQSEKLTRDKATWAMVQTLQAAKVPVNEIQQAAMQVQSGRMDPEVVLANLKAGRPLVDTSKNKQINIDNVGKTLAAQAGIANVPTAIKPIQGALDKADPSMAPEIKKYFDSALKQLDEIIAQQPNDIWARVYRAHLKAEYTGNLEEAMNTWRQCQKMAADNPAPYFFLGEGYLKQGNLKESVNNISKAVALRALGK